MPSSQAGEEQRRRSGWVQRAWQVSFWRRILLSGKCHFFPCLSTGPKLCGPSPIPHQKIVRSILCLWEGIDFRTDPSLSNESTPEHFEKKSHYLKRKYLYYQIQISTWWEIHCGSADCFIRVFLGHQTKFITGMSTLHQRAISKNLLCHGLSPAINLNYRSVWSEPIKNPFSALRTYELAAKPSHSSFKAFFQPYFCLPF